MVLSKSMVHSSDMMLPLLVVHSELMMLSCKLVHFSALILSVVLVHSYGCDAIEGDGSLCDVVAICLP
jgi:hypothetical protein